jgi:hypothetical protein
MSSAARVTQKLERIDLECNLVVFRLTHEVVLHDPAPVSLTSRYMRNSVEEGFARPEALAAFVSGDAPRIETIEGLRLVRPDLLTLVHQLGYVPGHDEAAKGGNPLLDRPFERLRTRQACLDDIVVDDSSAHMFFDRHRKVLPVGLHFSYLEGMDDRAFDLQRALALIQDNPQVRSTTGPRKPDTLCIQPIPYYNRDSERSAHIEFVFSPSREQMQAMWDWARKHSRQYPSTQLRRAVLELDLLGLRAGGACRPARTSESD